MTIRIEVLSLICGVLLGFVNSAQADNYAYMGTGNSTTTFGVVDLGTGVFTQCGEMQAELSGLGVGPDKSVYGGGYDSNTFYKVDVTNGNLTTVATSNVDFFLTGSTLSGLFAIGFDSNLYSMNADGVGTLIGPIGLAVSNSGWWSLSTNSKSLYFSNEANLYKLNLTTGAAKLIGTANQGLFGASVMEHGTLFAGSVSPLAIYTLSTRNGSGTFVSNLSGNGLGNPWGLVAIKEKNIKQNKICNAHKIG